MLLPIPSRQEEARAIRLGTARRYYGHSYEQQSKALIRASQVLGVRGTVQGYTTACRQVPLVRFQHLTIPEHRQGSILNSEAGIIPEAYCL